jgi:hypothetical protein
MIIGDSFRTPRVHCCINRLARSLTAELELRRCGDEVMNTHTDDERMQKEGGARRADVEVEWGGVERSPEAGGR